MLADLRPEGHVAAGDLRCQIVDQPLRRLQPARPDPVPVAAAGLSAVCVVLPSDRIASLAFEGLLDNEPGRQLHQLGPAVRRCEPALDQIAKGLARTHRRRYSLGHGVPPCWRRRQPAPIAEILSQDAPLPNFPATLGLHHHLLTDARALAPGVDDLEVGAPAGGLLAEVHGATRLVARTASQIGKLKINHNRRRAWHYVFNSANSEMADFCGFQTLDLAPSVEDRSQAEIRERAAV